MRRTGDLLVVFRCVSWNNLLSTDRGQSLRPSRGAALQIPCRVGSIDHESARSPVRLSHRHQPARSPVRRADGRLDGQGGGVRRLAPRPQRGGGRGHRTHRVPRAGGTGGPGGVGRAGGARGTTSMKVLVEAFRADPLGGTRELCANDRFVMVAVDEAGRPVPWRRSPDGYGPAVVRGVVDHVAVCADRHRSAHTRASILSRRSTVPRAPVSRAAVAVVTGVPPGSGVRRSGRRERGPHAPSSPHGRRRGRTRRTPRPPR